MLSLRGRLLVAIVLVSGATLALGGWLSKRYVEVALDQRLMGQSETGLERFAAPIESYFSKAGRWNGVEPVVQKTSIDAGRRVLLVGTDDHAIAMAPEPLSQARVNLNGNILTIEWAAKNGSGRIQLISPPHLVLHDAGGANVGTLYFMPLEQAAGPGTRTEHGLPGRRLVISLAGLLVLALTATFILSRRILRPLESLKQAVQKMERGDFLQRVNITSHDEIGELGAAFNHMAASRARAEQMRRDMVSDVAHELRTPVTNIRCQLEAIQDGLDTMSPEMLTSLQEETLHLGRLLDDLQDLALADAGELIVKREVIFPASLVQAAASTINPRLAAGDIALELSVSTNLPAIYADPFRAGQVLRNLLDNAAAYTPRGGKIEVRGALRGREVEFTVKDSGPGIPAEHLPHIFERFYRTDPSRSRQTGGTGLGLAIVQHLVTAQGGSVRVESIPGQGASFSFTLPVYEDGATG